MVEYAKVSELKGRLFTGIKPSVFGKETDSRMATKDYGMLADRGFHTVLKPGWSASIAHSNAGHNNRTGTKLLRTIASATGSAITSLIPIPAVGGLINAVASKVDAEYRSYSLGKAATAADPNTDEGMAAWLKPKLKLIDAVELDRARSKVEEAYKICCALEADLKQTTNEQYARCDQIKNAAQSVAYLIKRAEIFKHQAVDMQALANIMNDHADKHLKALDPVIVAMRSAVTLNEAQMSRSNHKNCKVGACVLGDNFKIKDDSAQEPSVGKGMNPFGAKEISEALASLFG